MSLADTIPPPETILPGGTAGVARIDDTNNVNAQIPVKRTRERIQGVSFVWMNCQSSDMKRRWSSDRTRRPGLQRLRVGRGFSRAAARRRRRAGGAPGSVGRTAL